MALVVVDEWSFLMQAQVRRIHLGMKLDVISVLVRQLEKETDEGRLRH